MDEELEKRSDEEGLTGALRNLGDGVSSLVRNQFRLLRLEVQREASEAGSRGAGLFVAIGVALLGYGFLLLTLVLGVGLIFGRAGMTTGALIVGLGHLVGGLFYVNRYVQGFQRQRERIEQKTRSLDEEPWLEENRES